MRKPLGATLATLLCAGPFAPAEALAQSTIYVRLLPEVAVTSVMHEKQVTSGAGSSSSESSTIGPEGAFNFYLGYLRPAGGDWVIGGEVGGAISLRREIDGVTPIAGSGSNAVWPGPWNFTNRVGLGGNIMVGRDLTFMESRGYFFVGIARWSSDFRSAGADPGSAEEVDDESGAGRWPLTTGIGLTLPFVRLLDVRLRYFRSATSWTVERNVNQEALAFDYRFVVNGLALSLGLGTR